MAAPYAKPLPLPDLDTAEFWAGCKAHELRAQRCSACNQFRWPPQGICPHCYSWDFKWEKLSETGTVYSYVVVYHEPGAFSGDVPYVVANVTMDDTAEQVRIMSNLVDVPREEIRVGMRVRVTFEDVTPEISLPKFRRA